MQSWDYFAWFAIALNSGNYIWQAIEIIRKRSGVAVSTAWFSSSVGLEAVNVIYGWSKEDGLFMTNAIISAVGQILVLLALRTYKPLGKKEKIVIASILLVILAALVTPFKNTVQVLAQAINLYGGKDQPDQLKAGRGTGALALGALILSGLSGLIWTGYCLLHFGLWSGPPLGFAGFTAYSGYGDMAVAKKRT